MRLPYTLRMTKYTLIFFGFLVNTGFIFFIVDIYLKMTVLLMCILFAANLIFLGLSSLGVWMIYKKHKTLKFLKYLLCVWGFANIAFILVYMAEGNVNIIRIMSAVIYSLTFVISGLILIIRSNSGTEY